MATETRHKAGPVFKAIVICVLTASFFTPISGASSPVNIKHVLVLYPQDSLAVPAYRMVYTGIKTVFVTDSESHINLFNESLDLALFPEENDQRRLAEFLHTKYASDHIDVIIAVTFPALNFVLRQRETAFPGVSVVFCALNVDDLS
jgi:hypothetical protein